MTSINSVSLLIGKTEVPIWFGLAVEEMVKRVDVDIDDITIASHPRRRESNVNKRLENLIVSFQDQIILSNLDREIDVRLLSSVSEDNIRWCNAERTGEFGVRIPEHAIKRISNNTDVVVHHGVGILKGDILRKPDYGVLGYHHGDIREYRGPGYGFWEYMNDENTSGVTLQILDDCLDAGQIVEIESVDITDAHTLAEVRNRLNAASVPLLAAGLEKLGKSESAPIDLKEDELGDMYYYSDINTKTKIKYLLKELVSRLMKQFAL